MKKVLPGLLTSLLIMAQAASCAAQGGARAPKDEDALAAALRLARGLEPGMDKEGALVRLVQTHRAAGRLEEAVRAAREMDGAGMKSLMLCRLANTFAEAGRLERAAELLSESLQTIRSAEDDQGFMDDLLYNIVRGEVRFDFESFPPRNETRKGALARLFEAGRAEAAARILSQVREVALDPDRDDLNTARVLARAARLQAASDPWKAAGLLSEALAAARRVEDAREKITSLCEVARAYADVGDRKAAEALLDEAQQFATALDEYRDDELKEVAAAYSSVGLTAKALKATRDAGGEEWDSEVAAVEATAAAERPEALKESLTRAIARVASLEGENNKSDALSSLAVTYGTRAPDLLADVLWAAHSVGNDYYRARALAAVGDKYAEAGRKEAALDAWAQAYESARAVKLRKSDFHPSSSSRMDGVKLRLLCTLASRLIRAGEYGRAPEIAGDMRAVQSRVLALTEGSRGSVQEVAAALAGLADALTLAGQKEQALSVLAEAVDADAKQGKNTNSVARADSLVALGAAYVRAGDKGRAAACFSRALQLADEDEEFNEESKLQVLIEVGSRYAEAGMRPDARARRSLRRLVRKVEAEKE